GLIFIWAGSCWRVWSIVLRHPPKRGILCSEGILTPLLCFCRRLGSHLAEHRGDPSDRVLRFFQSRGVLIIGRRCADLGTAQCGARNLPSELAIRLDLHFVEKLI